jgi:hypothetical protein
MGDAEAFQLFVKDEMPRICRVVNFNVEFRGELQPLEKVLYKWLRCELVHSGALPTDVTFEPDPLPGITRIQSSGRSGTFSVSHGWLDGLADAVVHAPENSDQFGSPAIPPVPISLPRLGLTIEGPHVTDDDLDNCAGRSHS